MASSLHDLVARALALVARDAAPCARAMADALGPAVLALWLDHEVMTVAVAGGVVAVVAARPGDASARARSESVLALIEGRDTLVAAVRANRVRIQAPRGHAAALFDVARRFAEGCLRSPGGPALLAELRGRVALATERC